MTFESAKLISALFEPLGLLALVLCALSAFAAATGKGPARATARGAFVLALFFASMAVFPIGEWALLPLENRFADAVPPARVDGIVVLTGDENARVSETRGFPVAGHAGQRYLYLARLAARYPQAKVVIVGTTAALEDGLTITTRDVIEPIVAGLSLSASSAARVVYEERSRTTRENALFSLEKAAPQKGESWLLVSSAFHLPRAALCFAKAGWTVDLVPAAADYFTAPTARLWAGRTSTFAQQIRFFSIAAHEYVGLLVYRLRGWTDALWP